MIKTLYSILVFSILAIVFVPTIVNADAKQQVLEEKDGDALMRISYDQDKAGLGEPVPFTFDLLKGDESSQLDFESLRVRIKPEGLDRDLFIADVNKSSTGLTSITYDFPESGIYTFDIQYMNGEKLLADHSFDFEISKSTLGFTSDLPEKDTTIEESKSSTPQFLWIITLVAGLIGGWILRSFKKQ
jgi:hypothetical protein